MTSPTTPTRTPDEQVIDIAMQAELTLNALIDFAIEAGEHLTCTEIESLAALYRAAGMDQAADEIVGPTASHARHDEPGDDHYLGGDDDE